MTPGHANGDVGLVLPAYQPNVQRLARYADELSEEIEPTVLRIELDAPREGDVAALEAPSREVHTSPQRRGKGAAIMRAFDELDTDVLAFVDADASTAVPSFRRVVEGVGDGTDVAVGSRRHPDAHVTGRSALRETMSSGLVWLAKGCFDVQLNDYQCGAKALRREVWLDVGDGIEEQGFAWDMELLVAANSAAYTIEEIPVRWRGGAASSMNLVSTVGEFGKALVSIRRRAERHGQG